VSTAGEIVTRAMRAVNIIPIGAVPTAAELAEGVQRLNSLLRSLFGEELGVHFRDWPVDNSWADEQEEHHPLAPITDDISLTPWRYPPANSRLVVRITSPVTIMLPAAPLDGERISVVDAGSSANLTLSASGRRIEGSDYITNTPGFFSGMEWLYRADLGEWVLLQDEYAEADELPLHESVDDFFVTSLAIELSPRFGTSIEESIIRRQESMQARLLARYKVGALPLSPSELRTILRTTP
jgi:hypothetical protein